MLVVLVGAAAVPFAECVEVAVAGNAVVAAA